MIEGHDAEIYFYQIYSKQHSLILGQSKISDQTLCLFEA